MTNSLPLSDAARLLDLMQNVERQQTRLRLARLALSDALRAYPSADVEYLTTEPAADTGCYVALADFELHGRLRR